MSTIKWLSPHTLAQRWGVSRETILRAVRTGELPVHRVNSRVYRIAETDAAVLFVKRYGNIATFEGKPGEGGLSGTSADAA
jgi:excisionase family DNA binding protein